MMIINATNRNIFVNSNFSRNKYPLSVSFKGADMDSFSSEKSGKQPDNMAKKLMDLLFMPSVNKKIIPVSSKKQDDYNELYSKTDGPCSWARKDMETITNLDKVTPEWVEKYPKLAGLIYFVATGNDTENVKTSFASSNQFSNVLNAVISDKKKFAQMSEKMPLSSISRFYKEDIGVYKQLKSAISSNDFYSQIGLNIEMAKLAEKRNNPDDMCAYYEKALTSISAMKLPKEKTAEKELYLHKALAVVYEKKADKLTVPEESKSTYEKSFEHYKNVFSCLFRKGETKSIQLALVKEDMGRLLVKRAGLETNPENKNNFINSAGKCYKGAVETFEECSPKSSEKLADLYVKTAEALEMGGSKEEALIYRQKALTIG